MIKKPSRHLAMDSELILKDVRKEIGRHVEQPARRTFLQRSLTYVNVSQIVALTLLKSLNIV